MLVRHPAAAALALALSVSSSLSAQQGPLPSFMAPQFSDVKSAATGATHRIWTLRPNGDPPAGGFPVLYLLDGSWYFQLTLQAATIMMRSGDMPRAIIVGIGYDDPAEARRLRVRDFTTPAPASAVPPQFIAWKAEPGGLERFMRFMTDELKPMVAAGSSVNPRCQVLVGHSLSGLFALESLLRDPAGYRSYVIGDPSAWWNSNEPLQGFYAFANRLRASGQPVNVLVAASTVPGTGPGIDSLRTLLTSVKASGFTFEYRRFEDETHNSMLPGFLAIALRRGLACCR
jgi:predicted alpha/beta superfamily hydrolase